MSEEPKIVEDSPEQMLEWMKVWKEKVEGEIALYESGKQKVYVVYKRQKDMYDKWLSGRLKKMKKFDGLINNRKKVLIDVNKEIAKLESATLGTPK